MKMFSDDPTPALHVKEAAQRIAFAPMVFQATRVLRDSGILELVKQSGTTGLTLDELKSKTVWPPYGVKVLLEAGLGIGLFFLNDDRFILTELGRFILRDPMTRVNMDFVHDVCYRGLFDLERATKEGRPAGLRSLGDGQTVYKTFPSLPLQVQRSWYAFDHYYSDLAFPAALPLVFANHPRRLLDIGGNSGKWAVQCAKFDSSVQITIADLPCQLQFAKETIRQAGVEDRTRLLALDILDESQPFPTGYDAIWMSQLLDCFSPEQIISILRRTAHCMDADSALYILDVYWDWQPNEVAAFCLQQTSLYFTCIANGNSKIYRSADIIECVHQSGLKLVDAHDRIGSFHTMFKCQKK